MPVSARVIDAASTARAPPHRREHAQRDGDANRHQHRRGGQFHGGRHAEADLLRDGLAGAQRRPQIAVHQADQEAAVLLEERPVEAQPLPQRLDVGLRRRLAQHRLRRIARNEMNRGRRPASPRRAGPERTARAGARGTRPRRRFYVRSGPGAGARQAQLGTISFSSPWRDRPSSRGGLAAMPAGARQGRSHERRSDPAAPPPAADGALGGVRPARGAREGAARRAGLRAARRRPRRPARSAVRARCPASGAPRARLHVGRERRPRATRAAAVRQKWSASSGTSSGRSRSGGTAMRITSSR